MSRWRLAAVGMALLLVAAPATAQTDGAWNADADGNWSDGSKWAAGIASGTNATADFTGVNISADRTVTLDTAGRVIGHLKFADAGGDGSDTKSWTLAGANTLTLATGGGTPTVGFGAKNGNAGNTLRIGVPLAGTEGVLVRQDPALPYTRPVYFTRANTYRGNTTVTNAGILVAADARAVSTGTVAVAGGSCFYLHDNVTLTNNIVLQDGATFGVNPSISYDANVTVTGGTITLQGGTATLTADDADLLLRGVITESVAGSALRLGGTGYGSYGEYIHIYRENTFTGPTVITNLGDGGWVQLFHSNGLGSAATTVTVSGESGNSDEGKLWLYDAPVGLNPAKTIVLGSAGQLFLGGGLNLANTINSCGGLLGLTLSADTTCSGILNLATGTVTTINMGSGSARKWNQTGTIAGAGGLLLTGVDVNSAQLRFYGTNTFSGGTRISAERSASGDPAVYTDTGLGAGPITFDSTSDGYGGYAALALGTNVTMANEFRGSPNASGKTLIGTGAFTLTATGAFRPCTVFSGVQTSEFGLITAGNVRLGSDTQGCTYYWQYDETTNDLVSCATLQFGAAVNILQAEWIGADKAPLGEYVIMTFGATPPAAGNWKIVHSAGYKGRVRVDAANGCLRVKFWRAGTVVALR